MKKQQLISLVQELEEELGSLSLKNPVILQGIGDKLTKCKSKLIAHHADVIEEIDEFIDLLNECDIDGVIELDEMFGLIDQLHDLLEDLKSQMTTNRNISQSLLLETKGLLESIHQIKSE